MVWYEEVEALFTHFEVLFRLRSVDVGRDAGVDE